VRRSPVLLLDEPTAGLDEPAEAAVLAAVRSAARAGAAVLVVAHRPGALAEADRSVAVRAEAVDGADDADPGTRPGPAAPLEVVA
jgi:ATP-binding cassette subfamily C protein CydD